MADEKGMRDFTERVWEKAHSSELQPESSSFQPTRV